MIYIYTYLHTHIPYGVDCYASKLCPPILPFFWEWLLHSSEDGESLARAVSEGDLRACERDSYFIPAMKYGKPKFQRLEIRWSFLFWDFEDHQHILVVEMICPFWLGDVKNWSPNSFCGKFFQDAIGCYRSRFLHNCQVPDFSVYLGIALFRQTPDLVGLLWAMKAPGVQYWISLICILHGGICTHVYLFTTLAFDLLTLYSFLAQGWSFAGCTLDF